MNNKTNVVFEPPTRKPPMIDRSKYPMEIVQALMDERGIDEKSARRILYNRDYRKLNKDRLNQNRRYYYHEIVKKSPYMLKHFKEYNKKYYEEHKEKYKARTRQWIKDHPDSVSCETKKEYNHTYYMRKIKEKRRMENEAMAQRLNISSSESTIN